LTYADCSLRYCTNIFNWKLNFQLLKEDHHKLHHTFQTQHPMQ
jgi:hypothetical protein